MIVTGGFFCDAANVSDGKLNVLGGVWDWLHVEAVGPDALHWLIVVILLQREPGDDADQTEIVLQTIGPDGTQLSEKRVPYRMPPGSNLGFVILKHPVLFDGFGRHVFVLSTREGAGTSLALDVRPAG